VEDRKMESKYVKIGIIYFIAIVIYFSSIFVTAEEFTSTKKDDGSISGMVLQVNGNPIMNAKVEVIRQDFGGWWEVFTDSDGNFIVSSLPAGDFKIRAFKSGYAREYYNNVFYSNEAEIISLEESEDKTGIDFSLTLGGAISGLIYDLVNGRSIEGARIDVRPSKYYYDDGFYVFSDSDGYYLIDGLALGYYKVRADATTYSSLRYYDDVYGWDNADNVMVVPPETTQDIDISLELAGSISGFVFASDEVTPISYASIIADPINGGYEGIGARSNEDGSYIINSLPPNEYTLRVSDLPGWYASEFYDSKITGDVADIITVSAGEDTSNIIFTIDEGGWLTGYVFDEETGEPISDLQLEAILVGGGHSASAPGTIYDGSFKFVLHEGEYLIKAGIGVGSAHGQKYIPEWYDNSYVMEDATPVSVRIYQETSDINFYLSKAGSITGYVKSDDGNPISGASVYAYSDDFPGSGALTQEDGIYVIEGLPSGDYFVQVTVLGYISEYYDDTTSEDDATLVRVNAPEETPDINFVLIPGETLPPEKPSINGPNKGRFGNEYTYIAITTDPDGDKIYYLFDWGDGSDSDWFGPFDSGQEVNISHTWENRGTYEIKAKAKDIYSVQSEWSDPLSITMPKNKIINRLFLNFLQQHPNLFPILRQLSLKI
jgi:hypothetical protein